MKNIFLFLVTIWLIVGCSSTRHSIATNDTTITNPMERDGSSYENAVYIKEKTETKGVAAEYAWLKEHFPGYTSKGQMLTEHKNKPFDIINIVTQNGYEKSIYFDISGFYGKF